MVKVGSTIVIVASVATVASAAPVPSALNDHDVVLHRAHEQGQPEDAVAR